MPDVATAPTATAAQTQAAGSRILGYYLGGGGVKVDCLFDTSNFMVKDGDGTYRATPAANKDVRIVAAAHDTIAAPTGGLTFTRTDGGQLQSIFGTGDGGLAIAARASIIFATGGASGYSQTVECARITEGGNLGIGTGAPVSRLHVKSNNEIARLETTVPRGVGQGFLGFADPTGRKGYVGFASAVNDSFFVVNEMNWPMYFGINGSSQWQINAGDFMPTIDAAMNFGAPASRIANSYFSVSPTVTSDIRLKFYRADPAPTADEHAAALECFEVFGFFQYLDAIAREQEGGSTARWHFGPKAQEVWSIFAAHGLAAELVEDASGDLVPPPGSVPPAFLCFDEWGEETAPVLAWWRPSEILGPDGQPVMVQCAEGEEGTEQRPTGETYVVRDAGNIFGVRIDQLQSLMLVALNRERKDHAARLAALEAHLAAPGQ